MELSALEIYRGKKVFITGDTGFKGSWLTLILQYLQAEIAGYSLAPLSTPNHFDLVNKNFNTRIADILDVESLKKAVREVQPEIIFHLAAQALVRTSYTDPVNTYQTNVIGTMNVLEAARSCDSVKAVVLITTDKVYDNKESEKAYHETDELGGYDMYSSSKACCEILIRSYRNSFLNPDGYKEKHHILIASARAGNVIGGGDWSADRLIPDIVRATAQKQEVQIRNPKSVRPWQHVLDCIYGYLLLGAKLLNEEKDFGEAWNFSPYSSEVKNVGEIVAAAAAHWPEISVVLGTPPENYHEAGLLILDNGKAVQRLGWKPVWTTADAVKKTIGWYRQFYDNGKVISSEQVSEFLSTANAE